MPKCCVRGCGSNYSKKAPLISLHKLPKNDKLESKWPESLGQENIDSSQEKVFVCSLHFEESCINRSLDIVRLHDNAIPTRLPKIFAASTIITVAAENCNGNYEYVDSTIDDPLCDGKMKIGGKKRNMKVNVIPPQGPSDFNVKITPSAPLNGPKKRERCCPYDFDSKRCKIVDDRVLCGYNRNANWPQSKDTVVEMHGGCRLRAGRLECGYQHGPYTNARRPPVWDNPPPNDLDVGNSQFRPKA